MRNIFERFSEIVEKGQDTVFCQILDDGKRRSFTFGEYQDRVMAAGRFLSGIGIKKGDRVAILSGNSPEWGIAYLGIVSIGAVAVPLDAQYTEEEVENLLKDSESKAIFTSKALLGLVQEASKGLNVDVILLDEPLPENPPSSPFAKGGVISEDDLSSILYTSGTTGIPKGVMLTHGNLLSNADAIIKTGIVSHNDHVLGILPLHHTYPFMVCFLVPLLVGGRVTFLNSLKGPDIVKTIREEGVTVLVGVPHLYSMMRKGILGKIESLPGLKRSIARALFVLAREVRRRTGLNIGKVVFKKVHREFGERVRFFTSGGARLDPSIKIDMEGVGFTLLDGYGLTETSPVATFNTPGRDKVGSVGRAIEQVDVKVENADQSGVGELIIKGPNVMKGYYMRPDLTAEVIKGGWFHSGDLGYIDSDGYLFITGRSKEVIVLSSGKNIYPEDIESHYLQSPYIKEVCVVGIPDPSHPGSLGGIKALVFPNYEKLAADGIVNIRDWIKWQIEKLSASLSAYKRVSGFSILKKPLPRTHLGKIRRFMVQDEEAGPGLGPAPALSDEDQRLIDSDIGRTVFQSLSAVTDKKISISSHLELDLGIDSLGREELMVALENGLGVSLPQSFPSEVATVRDIIVKLTEQISGGLGPDALKKPVSWAEILQQAPSEEMLGRISLRRGFVGNVTLALTVWFLYILFRTFLRLEVRGIENVPKEGACIVAPNHVSYIDGFVVGTAIRSRMPKLYGVGFRGFFHGPLTSRLARWGHIISIDADSGLSESLQASAYALKEGVALIVFPEGGRSVDGRIMPFKKGVGILAKELNVPLIPTYIEGALDVLPRGSRLPRFKKVVVTFGKPLASEDVNRLDYQSIVNMLREEVIAAKS